MADRQKQRSMMLPFQGAAVERAFQLHHSTPRVTYDLCISCIGLLSLLLSRPGHAQLLVVRAAMFLGIPLLYWVIGHRQYLLCRGLQSVWFRLCVATGLAISFRPGDCKYCGVLWQHRLLFTNLLLAVGRIPAVWFWCGGLLSWITTIIVDTADPAQAYDHDIACLLGALQSNCASPVVFLQHIAFAACSKPGISMLMFDVVLPGIVLTWHEMNAHKRWWQQQQWPIPAEVLAAPATSPAAEPHSGAEQRYKKQPQQQIQASVTKDIAPARSAHALPAQYSNMLEDRPSCSGDRTSPRTSAEHPTATAAVASQTRALHQDSNTGSGSDPSFGTPSSTVKPGASTVDAATLESPVAQALQHSASPTPHNTQQPASSTSSTAQDLVVTVVPVAVNHLPALAQQPQQTHHDHLRNHHPLLYHSAVDRQLLSFKFNRLPSTSPADIQRFQQQLADAVRAAALARIGHQSTAPAAVGAFPQQQPSALVTDSTSFPGCFQVLLHVVLPQGLGEQLETQHLQHAAQQILASWPDCSLISVEQSGQQQTVLPADTAAPGAVRVAGAALEPAGIGNSDRHAVGPAHPIGAPQWLYLSPVAVAMPTAVQNRTHSSSNVTTDSSASAPAVASCAGVRLCIPKPLVCQLLMAGQTAVRVVVSSQLPAGELLLDRTFQLQEPSSATAAVDIVLDATEGAQDESAFALDLNLQYGNASEPEQEQRQIVRALTVVVLAENCSSASTGLPAAGEAAEASAAQTSSTAAAVAPLHGVLAKLPLLVLPTGAATELKELYDVATEAGMSRSAAYAGMLPFLQDFAAIILSRSDQDGGATELTLYKDMLGAVLACCHEYALWECKQLLQSDVTPSEYAESTTATAVNVSEDVRRSRASSSSQCNDKQADSTLSKDGSSGSSGSRRPQARAEAAILQEFDAEAFPPAAYQLGLRSLLFGFKEPALEAAYRAYVGAVLHTRDFWCMVLYMLYVVFLAGRLLGAILNTTARSEQVVMIEAGIHSLFPALHASAHGMLWAAGTGQQSLHKVQQQRCEILAGGELLLLGICAAFQCLGGTWARASMSAIQTIRSPMCLFLVYRHVVQPMLMCGVIVPPTLTYLLVQLCVFDPLFGRIQLFGMSAGMTAVLLGIVHLAIVTKLEHGLRTSFVQHVRESTPQHDE